MKNFPTNHCHPSSLDSGSTPESFAERELQLETGCITATDHGSMGACSEIYDLAQKHKLIPILGLEAYVRDDDCPILAKHGIEKVDNKYDKYNKYYHITLHALDEEGYLALVRTLNKGESRAEQHGSERKPLFSWADLEYLGQYNITMTSGCLIGMVQRHLLSGHNEIATAYYEKLRSIPKPGNFYVDLYPHRCTHYWVSGVFLDLGGPKPETIKLGKDRRIKTSVGEYSAEEAAKLAAKGKPLGDLLAVMTRRKWVDRQPAPIVGIKSLEDFMPNECTPESPDGDIQLHANVFVRDLANKYGDLLVIADDSHFATPTDKVVQDSKLSQSGNWRFHNSYHRQSSKEAFEYFSSAMGMSEKDFERLVQNNIDWSQRFKGFKFNSKVSLPTKFYPDNTLAYLKSLIDKHGRMDWGDPIMVDHLKAEIDLLARNGTVDLLPYFFLAEDVTYHYESLKLLTGPGRGSAAGLLLSYLIGVTHVNPLDYKLSRDRFLTVDRVQSGKMPDIDLDFPDRDVLLHPETGYLYKKFADHVAGISVDQKLRLKNAIRDTSRFLTGKVLDDLEVLCKKLPLPPQGINDYDWVFGYTGDDGKEIRGLLEESVDLQIYAKKYPNHWDIVQKMLGLTRQKGRHASAVVVTNTPVADLMPLTTISGIKVTQYTKDHVEARGGLKMDFLGLNSLNDLSKAIHLIQARHGGKIEADRILNGKRVPGFRLVPYKGEYYDIWDLPADTKVFNKISEGDTDTVFQLNTNSAKQWLKLFDYVKDSNTNVKAIDSIEAISAFTALDRPGPLDAKVTAANGKEHNMLVEYANRAKGLPASGAIPIMDKLLPETYGVMVYQEQLQYVYQHLTGCTGIEANDFRNNISKKKMAKVKEAYPQFMERASKQIPKDQAQAVWDQMVTFGQYGFNKSHSVCYSVIAYSCAFLKYHYPLEWWCAVLQNAKKTEISEKFWKHCSKYVLMPDIRFSGNTFEIEGDKIRAPLSMLKGVGENAHNELVLFRPITDIADLCNKIVAHKKSKATPVLDVNGKQVLNAKGQPKFRAGLSALNTGVVSKLIVSGVADSLFPKDTNLLDKFNLYQSAMTLASGKKAKIDPMYAELGALQRYQLQKQILEVHGANLLPLVADIKLEGVLKAHKSYAYYYYPESPNTLINILKQRGINSDRFSGYPLVTARQFEHLSKVEVPPGTTFEAAMVGYIMESREFSWKDKVTGKQKTAVEIILDVEGQVFKMVKWPNKDTGKIAGLAVDTLTGSVVVCMASRWKTDRDFGCDALVVVQPPLKAKESSQEE
jgi:DNA-directed DNA polymerase III PolC